MCVSVRLSVHVWEAAFALFYRQVLLVSPLVCVCDFGLEFAYESFCELVCESASLSFFWSACVSLFCGCFE